MKCDRPERNVIYFTIRPSKAKVCYRRRNDVKMPWRDEEDDLLRRLVARQVTTHKSVNTSGSSQSPESAGGPHLATLMLVKVDSHISCSGQGVRNWSIMVPHFPNRTAKQVTRDNTHRGDEILIVKYRFKLLIVKSRCVSLKNILIEITLLSLRGLLL